MSKINSLNITFTTFIAFVWFVIEISNQFKDILEYLTDGKVYNFGVSTLIDRLLITE